MPTREAEPYRYAQYLIVEMLATIGEEGEGMKGVEFVIDEMGKKRAVLIDLKRHRELWEDFYDTLLAKDRESEPRESLQEFREKSLGKGLQRRSQRPPDAPR